MRSNQSCVVGVISFLVVLATSLNATSPVGRRVSERRLDTPDLEAALSLVARLHPDVNRKARVTAMIGSLDGQWASPLIDITLEDEGGVWSQNDQGAAVPTARRKVYGAVFRFDALRRLQTYKGGTTAGDERFRKVVERLRAVPPNQRTTLAAFRSEGARFLDQAPTRKTCQSLALIASAIGRVASEVPEGAGPFADQLDQEELKDVSRDRLAWNILLVAQRDGVTKKFGVTVDPWGDVLTVSRYGEAWP